MTNSILIIDDSPFLHKLLRASLEAESLVVYSAYDGEAALAAAAELKPSLILLDVDMPNLDGFEVCKRLKDDPVTADIPIIFVTSVLSRHDKVKGLNLGAADYITKPFTPEELQARVRLALRTQERLEKLAMVDPLTGLWNHSHLEVHFASQLSLSRRSGRPLACVAADVDRLGAIHQQHGHAFGDEVLRAVSHVVMNECRTEDAVFHCGNGRFVALMSGTHRVGAARVAERIRSQVERQLLSHAGVDAGVTCSFGVADSADGRDAAMLERAEAALRCAKESGGNTVVPSVSTGPGESRAIGAATSAN